MKRACLSLAVVALGALLATSPARAQSCSIGGHNETAENFNPGGWSIVNMTPGSVAGAVGTHLLISEVAPRGAGTGAASDSSEYVEIYNPTTRRISLGNKYISDDSQYFRIVNGAYMVANTTDWTLRFPAGLALDPGRTVIVCVTKAGFAGSGASPGAAQHFLEMRDTNGNPADDMVLMTPNSSFLLTGGSFTNPASTNGEWVVLFCWNGSSDRVCDIDYASWGANSASNPKMDKTGIAIDGPDAGAATSTYLPDTPAAGQTNLGNSTTLVKPNTYQRTGAEVGEPPFGGNGCAGQVTLINVTWVPVVGPGGAPNIRFHAVFRNPDEDSQSPPMTGSMMSQEFGVFLPDYGSIGTFNVPPLQPNSFFDVFIEIPLSMLPPPPQKMLPGGGGGKAALFGGPSVNIPCPPDTNWAGNVDIQWSGPGQGGQVNRHYSDLINCPGGPPSYIHFRPSNCPSPMPWSAVVPCAGWSMTLVNEDFTPAPNPVPVGWSGWICVSADASVISGSNCCMALVFQCDGATGTIEICSTACDWQTTGVPPVLTTVDWTTAGGVVTFHQHWENPNSNTSAPVNGDWNSQAFGVFLPDYGPIGTFSVPPLAPSSFFDVFTDIPLSQLPPEPTLQMPGGGPGPGTPCDPPDHWHGNVDITWTGGGTGAQVNKHFGEMPVCPGAGPTYLFVETNCTSALGASWSISGLCPGFSATLVNPDNTPAPNPVPPGWIGKICVSAAAVVPSGTVCCFKVNFICGPVPGGELGVIDVCARACNWGPQTQPVLSTIDWVRLANLIRFHLRWTNPGGTGEPTKPVSGNMNSQQFGLFMPDFGPIGEFNVPPIQPNSFFDVFMEVPLSALPPEPREILPGGGPGPGAPCPPDTSWSGNVDIQWAGASGPSQVGYHFSNLLVRPGSGTSHVHALIFCNSTLGATWSIAGLCPGFTATLLNEDFTPAPNPVPPNWTGWISVGAANSVPPGTTCCFSITFVCDGQPGTIDVCATTCQWANTDVPVATTGTDFGIVRTAPNPASIDMLIDFVVPKNSRATVAIYDLSGKRVLTLFDGVAEAGVRSVRWNGRGEAGRRLSPGAYFVKLQAGNRLTSKKVVLFH